MRWNTITVCDPRILLSSYPDKAFYIIAFERGSPKWSNKINNAPYIFIEIQILLDYLATQDNLEWKSR